MADSNFDLIVIGSGPGGYTAAIRAHQLGLKTAIVERDRLGGVCLNWGCIPTKALLRNAEHMHFLNHAADFGFGIEGVTVDFERVIARSREVADVNSSGVEFLMKKNIVTVFKGNGFIPQAGTVEVRDNDGKVTDTLTTRAIIIATGARPRMIPGIEVDLKRVITSTEAMLQKEIPKSMIIIGAGAIGVEFAYFYNAFGTKITIIEMQPRVVPVEDADSSKELERAFRKRKMEILTETKVLSAKAVGDGVEVVVEDKKGQQKTLTADIALNAVGVVGNTENIGLEGLGVAMERGWIKVDEFLRTNVPGIYSIGDVAGAPWLAHKASHEGIVAAEHIAGHATHGINYKTIPGCTYCQPQVASVGLTEAKARELGYDVKVGRFPFKASGKARAIGETDGFVKLVIDGKYGEILGGHIVGVEATEMIAEICTAIAAEATAETLINTIHAHPTLSESVMEAAADAYGMAVNM
ncbi:MAG TPA: dihydrolipoyl dehydrogenase [Candidatus Kapabacteria bacterium]|nr:dihydrolipoyl dehydrogenase [Candidatus Kapabacteria bacterium]